MPSPEAHAQFDSAAVLTRATLRAAEKLGLSQRDLARLLGVSPASMSRLTRGRAIDPVSKEGELALLFLRLFRSLDALVGGDEVAARAWFHARNLHLDGVPAELVAKVDGLVHAVEYLDAVRGRL
jgi:transcriptional regulator with XRE-family HTH domain